jgi:hypothetical protein
MSVFMLTTGSSGRAQAPEDGAPFTATALPRVPDPPQQITPKLSRRLLDSYGADTDSVQGHAA